MYINLYLYINANTGLINPPQLDSPILELASHNSFFVE